ncbi:MAG: hypothetical protein HOG97_06765, partial [Candidatus Marinimicrobia bacterium]|nr:hypothetical protein [Candidatus Neomarinimicrobiota bacterium]
MIRIKNILLLLVLTVNIIFTQYPSASFEYDEYLIDENSERASVTLQIDNPDLVDLGGITIFLYADPSVVKFDSESVSWNSDSPFQHESLTKNVDNDTLKIGASTGMGGDIFSVPFASIFDISFDIIGVADDNSLIEFITFQLGGHDPNYTENTTPTNIILVGEDSEEPPTLGCMDNGDCTEATCGYDSPYYGVSACNYNPMALTDDGNCEYEDCAGCDDVPNSGLVFDECGICGGDDKSCCHERGTYDGTSCTCDNTSPGGWCGSEFNGCDTPIDECGVCGGNNYDSVCVGTDDCVLMDCAGVCNGDDRLTPCGDCSDDSDCNFSVSIATFTDPTIMDNNFRSDNIEIPISLNDFDFVGFSQLSQGTQGFEGMAFSVNFDPRLLEVNSSNSIALIENMSYNFGVAQLNDSLSIISGILTDDANDPLYESLDGPIVNLSFDVIDYTPELHGATSEISLVLTSLNGVDILQDNIEDTGTLTIYTKACIDPFASTFDSNFICDCTGGNAQCENDYNDVCDENGILETSNIFNDGCILPEPDFTDVLSSRIGDEELIVEFDTYTLTIPE